MTELMDTLFSGLAGGLVNGAWISLLLVAATWAFLKIADRFRAVNAATRYGIWTITLAGVLFAHVAAAVMAGSSAPENDFFSGDSELAAATEVGGAANVSRTGRSGPAPTTAQLEKGALPDQAGSMVIEEGVLPTTSHTGSGTSTGPVFSLPRILSLLFALGLVAWLSAVVVRLAHLALVYRAVRRLTIAAEPVESSRVGGMLPEHLRGSVSIVESDGVSSPAAAGLFSPTILLPRGLVNQLTDEDLQQILLHEAAHLDRGDAWTILFQRFVECVLWHHPAMSWVASRLQESRETACDDWVVSRTQQPEAYVQSIGRLIELNLGVESFSVAPGLAAERGHLLERMRRVLNERIPTTSRLSGEQLAVAGGLGVLMLALVYASTPLMKFSFGFGSDADEFADEFVERHEAPSPPVPGEAPAAPTDVPPPPPAAPDMPPVAPMASEAPSVPPLAEGNVSSLPVKLPVLPPLPSSGDSRSAAAVGSGNSAALTSAAYASGDDLSVRSWILILNSARNLHSSHEKGRVLRDAATRMPNDDRVLSAYLDSAVSISSSSEKSDVLRIFIGSVELNSDRIQEVRRAADSISSNSDRESVLRALIDATK